MSTKNSFRAFSAFAALAGLAFAVSCQGFFAKNPIESITMSPTTASVPLNGTFQMEAYGVDTTGNQLGSVTSQVTWSSSDPSTVSVGENTGLLTGVALGTSGTAVTITASYEALTPQTASATVCVEGATDLVISPGTGTSTVGGNTFDGTNGNGGFTASVQSGGQTLDVTTATTWTSSNTTALTITGGEDPALVTTYTVTTSTPVTVTATYSCNTTSLTQSAVITVTP
jgi:hypothetical protein